MKILIYNMNIMSGNYLSMGNNSDSFAIAFHGFEILLDDLLAQIILPFLGGLGESLLLGFVPLRVTIQTLNHTYK